jgi:CRP/FNR family transcriptional regulator, cyclic AMP receptor protein
VALEASSDSRVEGAAETRPGEGEIGSWDLASLLELDPGLGTGLSEERRAAARARLAVRTVKLGPGGWSNKLSAHELFGVLVVDGALTHRVVAGPGRSLEVLAPGDLARPWQEDFGALGETWFSSLGESRLAVLDRRFAASLARWPPVFDALLERSLRRVRFLAEQAALDSRVGMERRVISTLWHLAERSGVETGDGILVPLPLTHQMLAELMGAQRPSVSAAISRLTTLGTIRRTGDRGWLLDPRSGNGLPRGPARPAGPRGSSARRFG